MSTRTKILDSASVIAGALGLVATLAPNAAYAQNAASEDQTATTEEIVVTAERRAGTAQKTATSLTVLAGDDLINQGKFSLKTVLENVPGITGGAAGSSIGVLGGGTDSPAAGLVIRGIPSNVGAGGSTTPASTAAAIYVDGVYSGIGGGYDLDRVEVLRGPQGTLYGRSATSGLVAIHTRNPDLTKLGVSATLEAGNYNLQRSTAALNLPIVNDSLALRISANHYERDGFINGDQGSARSNDARIKLLFKPNENFSLLVGAALQDNVENSGGRSIKASLVPTQVVYEDVAAGQVRTKFRQVWAELSVDLGFANITYQPSYRQWTQDGTLVASTPLGTLIQPVTTPKDHFNIHELRLSSNADSNFIWQIGALYYKNELRSTNSSIFDLPPGFIPGSPGGPTLGFTSNESRTTTAYGVFAQATYPLTDAMRLTGGARYDKTKVTVTDEYILGPFATGGAPVPPPFLLTGDAGKRTFNNFTYKVRLEGDLTPRNLLYASVATGFSPGDVVVTASCPASISPTPPCPFELKAETLTSFEIGSKNRFLDNKLQLNFGVFYSNYGAYQSGGINVNTLPGPPSFAPLASPMKSYGAEAELHYRITPADTLDVNFSWVRSRYVNKPPLFAQFVAENDVLDTNAPGSIAPIPVSASVAYQHSFVLPGGSALSLRGEVVYSSGHGSHRSVAADFDGQAALIRINSAAIGNLSAVWRANQNFSLSAYVRNVTNHQYFQKVTLDTVPGPPPTIYTYQQRYNDPRTVGVVLNLDF
jgi:outer membrane receptor protein involved in Fe transport